MKKPSLGQSLTTQQIEIVRLIRQNRSRAEIKKIMRISMCALDSHLYRIRKKTGIKNTMDVEEVKQWSRSTPRGIGAKNPMHKLPIAQHQLEVLELLTAGHNYRQIGLMLGIKYESARNAGSLGMKRLGVNQRHNRDRMAQLREALGQREDQERGNVTMADPMF